MKEKTRIWRGTKCSGAIIDCVYVLFCGGLHIVTGETLEQVKERLTQEGRLVEVEADDFEKGIEAVL